MTKPDTFKDNYAGKKLKAEDGYVLSPSPRGGSWLWEWGEVPVLDGSIVQLQFRRLVLAEMPSRDKDLISPGWVRAAKTTWLGWGVTRGRPPWPSARPRPHPGSTGRRARAAAGPRRSRAARPARRAPGRCPCSARTA